MQKKETILITGGTGFAGSHLVEALIQKGYSNIHVTSLSAKGGFVELLLSPQHIHKLNLIHEKPVFSLIKKLQPTQIYHLAATAAVGSSFSAETETLNNNLNLQLNLLHAVLKFTPKCKILAIGSALEYQPQDEPLKETDPLGPVNPYAVSKVLQDMLAFSYAKTHNLQIIQVRPFNHIGERQNTGFVIADFASQIVKIEQGKQDKIAVGNLSSVRDFSDVKDIAKGYILLMEKGKIGETYNLGSGLGYSIQEMLNILTKLAKKPIEVKIDPTKFRQLDTAQVVANNSKIKKLGWQPTADIKKTLARILNFYRQNT